MDPIDWPQILRRIVASGMTQPQIALHCGCSQSGISDLMTGKTTDPRTSLGLKLMRLADERAPVGAPTPNPNQPKEPSHV